MTEPKHAGLIADEAINPQLDEIEDQMAALIAEALLERIVKKEIANKSNRNIQSGYASTEIVNH